MSPTGALHGHKACADGWYSRKAAQERQAREASLKIAKQGEPGGFVDVTKAEDAVIGSTPLVAKETAVDPAQHTLAADPGINTLTADERAALEEYRKTKRVEDPSLTTAMREELIPKFQSAVNDFLDAVARLANQYDQVITQRDQARSERDTAKGTA
jgi:hypothetical protein